MNSLPIIIALVGFSTLGSSVPIKSTQLKPYPYANWNNPTAQSIIQTLTILAHLEDAEKTVLGDQATRQVEAILRGQGNQKVFENVFNKLSPSITRTQQLDSFLDQMLEIASAGNTKLDIAFSQNMHALQRFLSNSRHREQIEYNLGTYASGNWNEEKLYTTVQVTLEVLSRLNDATPDIQKSIQEVLIEVAANNPCVRESFGKNDKVVFISAGQQLKAILEELHKCGKAKTGGVQIGSDKVLATLKYLEPRIQELDDAIKQLPPQ